MPSSTSTRKASTRAGARDRMVYLILRARKGSGGDPHANSVLQTLNLEREIDGFISQLDIFVFKAIEYFALIPIFRLRPGADTIGIRER